MASASATPPPVSNDPAGAASGSMLPSTSSVPAAEEADGDGDAEADGEPDPPHAADASMDVDGTTGARAPTEEEEEDAGDGLFGGQDEDDAEMDAV